MGYREKVKLLKIVLFFVSEFTGVIWAYLNSNNMGIHRVKNECPYLYITNLNRLVRKRHLNRRMY